MAPKISLGLFYSIAKQLDHVQYKLGAKASLTQSPDSIDQIDCSGFARYMVFNTTSPAFVLVDGSANQHDWCEKNLKKIADYKGVGLPEVRADKSRLFIAFIPVSGGHGHVWFVNGGMTYESHGGAGVDSRDCMTPILRDNVCAVYEFPTKG